MRRAGFAISIALAGACVPPHAKVLDKYPPGVVGRTTVTYYDVQGRTIAELHASMRKNGPKIGDSSFVGETRSPLRVNWRTESTGPGSCALSHVTVTVTAQVLLPHWQPPADTEPGVFAEWTRFSAALETHEAGHKDITAKAGQEIVDRLSNLSGSCSMIGTHARDVANGIVDRASEAQRKYDADTRHGILQGTTFGRPAVNSIAANPNAPLKLATYPMAGTTFTPVASSRESVWAVLPAVFHDLGFGARLIDSVRSAMGDSMTMRSSLAGLAGTRVDCTSPFLGRLADSLSFTFLLTARLDSGMMPTRQPTLFVTTTLQTIAHPPTGPAIGCRSLGTLERQFGAALRQRLNH